MKNLGKIILLVGMVIFLGVLVIGSSNPAIFQEISSMFEKDRPTTNEIIEGKELIKTQEFKGDPHNHNYWATYNAYKDIINCSTEKYILVENGSTVGCIAVPVTDGNESAEVSIYALSKDEMNICLKNMNDQLIAFMQETGRGETIWPSGAYPQDINLLEAQFEDSIKTLTKSSDMGFYVSSPKEFLNGDTINFNINETKDFENYGLMVDTKNITVEKIVIFTKGRSLGIVSADVTTILKENKAKNLDWVPAVGETKRVSFFVDLVPTSAKTIDYNKNNIAAIQ